MNEQFDKLNHWYGWNGGERPVHPETEVELSFGGAAEGRSGKTIAGEWDWSHSELANATAARPVHIIAFRITKLYREPKKPREWWVNIDKYGLAGDLFARAKDAEHEAERWKTKDDFKETILVREVLPEDEA